MIEQRRLDNCVKSAITLHSMPDPWFRAEDGGLRATGVAVSPHAPGAQHGGAVAALVARAADLVPADRPMDIVRITVDLTKLVPVGLVTVDTKIRRDGRRLQVLDVTVLVDGEPRSQSEVLRTLRDEIIDPDDLPPTLDGDQIPVVPVDQRPTDSPWGMSPFMRGIECTFEAYQPGSGLYSLRLTDQMVDGEVMTPATRAAVAADLVMTAGGLAPGYAIVNTDVSLSMNRLPVGDVIRIASTVRLNRAWGSAHGALYDERGQFASVGKSLLVLGRRP
jgi:acyl-coenzyme A thioesterase PaaI-like protein